MPYFKNNADNKLAPIQIGEPYSDECATTKGYVDSTTTSNPNLLDNWYFPNPVNQRGVASLTAAGYIIDRWRFEIWSATNPSVSVEDGHIRLRNECSTTKSNSTKITQVIDDAALLAGKTVTFSAKLKNVSANVTGNGGCYIKIHSEGSSHVTADHLITNADANTIVSVTTTLAEDITSLYVVIGTDGSYGGKGNFDIEIESVKLELGSVSTLANDAPPSMAEQLLKCQRYFMRFCNTGETQFLAGACNGTTCYGTLLLPVPLAGTGNPTVTGSNVNLYPFVSGGRVAVNSVGGYGGSSRNWVIIQANYTATDTLPAQTPANIRIAAGGYIDISCEI